MQVVSFSSRDAAKELIRSKGQRGLVTLYAEMLRDRPKALLKLHSRALEEGESYRTYRELRSLSWRSESHRKSPGLYVMSK